ncbi:MAG: trigger factor [Candidatus Absconditabacteria bacterium]|nr:trigger factor [Candidatus Absconditabacteria bacterium]
MQKKVTKGTGAFYDIELTLTADDYAKGKEKALKEFQKDLTLPGFRKGFVPMHLVEEQVQPEYVSLSIYEHLINKGLQEVVAENATIRFVGEPYDMKQDKKDDDTIVSLKLDIFPEVEVKNNDWTSLSMKKISPKATKEEIDEAMIRLKKNYADYKDADVMARHSISKVSMSFVDKDGNEVDKGTLYVGEQEFDEFPFFVDTFVGKKKSEEFSIEYKKDLPPTVQTKKPEAKPTKILFTLTDIKDVVLPEINEETLTRLFGKESEVKNESDLLKYIDDSISAQKFDTELIKEVEDFLKIIRDKYMEVNIPQTLLNQEVHVRLENLEKRFGGKEKMEAYFKQMGDEKAKTFVDDISLAAKESLEKFFILQKVADELKLDINWEKPVDLEIERKLYDKLTGGDTKGGDKKVKKTTKK